MNQNCAGLNQYTGVQIQITYIKYGRAASNQNIIGKPAVQMDVIIRKQTIYVCAAYILLVQVEHGNIRVVLENHTGNNLVAQM